jgi:hypothetical protein
MGQNITTFMNWVQSQINGLCHTPGILAPPAGVARSWLCLSDNSQHPAEVNQWMQNELGAPSPYPATGGVWDPSAGDNARKYYKALANAIQAFAAQSQPLPNAPELEAWLWFNDQPTQQPTQQIVPVRGIPPSVIDWASHHLPPPRPVSAEIIVGVPTMEVKEGIAIAAVEGKIAPFRRGTPEYDLIQLMIARASVERIRNRQVRLSASEVLGRGFATLAEVITGAHQDLPGSSMEPKPSITETADL